MWYTTCEIKKSNCADSTSAKHIKCRFTVSKVIFIGFKVSHSIEIKLKPNQRLSDAALWSSVNDILRMCCSGHPQRCQNLVYNKTCIGTSVSFLPRYMRDKPGHYLCALSKLVIVRSKYPKQVFKTKSRKDTLPVPICKP